LNILIIPSWYPSPENAYTGIFIKEQAVLFARKFPEHNIGISTWGSNHASLLLSIKSLFQSPLKFLTKPKRTILELLPNCIEYFTPKYTWTRKLFRGNIKNIIEANYTNLLAFQHQFGKVNLIHAHACHPGGYVACSLSQRHNIPFIITEHMTPFPFKSYTTKNGISNYILMPLVRGSRIICVSEFLKNSIETHHKTNLVVINNFLDENFFQPNISLPSAKEKLTLLFIGRLVHQKGVDILLESFQILSKTYRHLELRIGGSGGKADEYLSMASQLSIDKKVKWLGELNRLQVKEELQNCTLLVLPSRHENNPVILLEALACGKPIIATGCGGPEEIVNQTNGLVAKTGSSDDLAKKIASIISNLSEYSPTLIRKEFMMRYSSKVVTQKLLDIYEGVLKM
jgi:glycosyltransferase involved in cell wall biosynthesis